MGKTTKSPAAYSRNTKKAMTLNEYQRRCNRKDGSVMYPGHAKHNMQGISYNSLALCGEAGEVANKVKKILRGDFKLKQKKEEILKELGGTFWYLAMLAMELGYTLEQVAQKNLDTIDSRLKRGTLRGDGDNR